MYGPKCEVCSAPDSLMCTPNAHSSYKGGIDTIITCKTCGAIIHGSRRNSYRFKIKKSIVEKPKNKKLMVFGWNG
jgi:DNA-directed RNA polymerase subunit M/transcription elongation factor TFIIS